MTLRRISNDDIHNITSGQVITDLNNIVKELVENSVDANATSITITFKRFGLEGLEVSDNGDGIQVKDFENLCRKNYTSKLENFEKLIDVKTLGFRGEALNSICNVADVSITTACTSDAPKGWELSFAKSGELKNKKIVNQSKGTLIQITDIFKNLPVRKINLEKHHRKEFQKCLQTLTSYLLILTNIRIIVYNVDISGKKKIMMKTIGNNLIKDNIVNVFGSSGLDGLQEINEELELDDNHRININGMVSNSSIGSGRLSKDRQYLFINNRPIEFRKILKLINTTYKKFNYLQHPMILLNFEIHEHLIDINVTPDKKTVLLSNKYETLLINKLESFLEDFWDNQGTYNIPVNDSYQDQIKERNSSRTQTKLSSFGLYQEAGMKDVNVDDEIPVELVERAAIRNSKIIALRDNSDHPIEEDEPPLVDEVEHIVERGVDGNDTLAKDDENDCISSDLPIAVQNSVQSSLNGLSDRNDSVNIEENIIKSQLESSIEVNLEGDNDDNDVHSCDGSCHSYHSHRDELHNPSETLFMGDADTDNEIMETSVIHNIDNSTTLKQDVKEDDQSDISILSQKVKIADDDLVIPSIQHGNISYKSKSTKNKLQPSDILDRQLSEKLLGLSIHKNDFIHMQIIGQFNKGFIIVYKKDTDDILIIDQHASDEKYNFEKFIEETTFENQPLVLPQKLDLNSIEKLVILNHLDVFEKNGFKFKVDAGVIDDTDEFVKQEELLLTSLPYSKNTIFDLKDLNELIQLIEDRGVSANNYPRPSKVRSMFAMRACRSSIMIGDPLSKPKMENVVQHLSSLDKPWNCPHGRPTMRHLIKVDQWASFNDDYSF